MCRAFLGTVLLLIVPLRAAPQQSGAGSLLVGGGVLFQADAVSEFSANICPGSEFISELTGGMLVLKWLGASVFGRVHGEILADECVNGLILPPPDSGRVVYTDYSAVGGYPYLSTGARITAFSGAPRGGAFRAYAGGEWLWGKSLLAPLFGLGLSIPIHGRVLLVSEAERRLLSVSYERVELTYRLGQIVTERREEHNVDALRWALRLGFELVLPR